ncbi:S8/S53 family peptidase [Deinococcus sp.]|uniref:S8 family peptidase n=1 Tax=Deinococcus sp. TaxID=47478 RepID=UPI0025F797C7|nr:S8/S53 family peptidase [Deinococcus sp.]
MKLPHRTAPLLLSLALMLGACGSQTSTVDGQVVPGAEATYKDVSVSINPQVLGSERKLEAQALEKHGQHANTLMRTEQGNIEFFQKEVIVKVTDEKSFGKFLKKYDGVVLNDGTSPTPVLSGAEKGNKLRPVPQGLWRLVQITTPAVSMDAMAKRLSKDELKGKIEFPDQETANLYYATQTAQDEFGLAVTTNYVMRPTGATGNDQDALLSTGGRVTPNSPSWYWQFKKTGVIRAWEELGYTGFRPDVGIIDTGFKPNDYELTGFNPIKNSSTWFKGNIASQQYDYQDGDTDVTSFDGDPDYNNSLWHGMSVAQVALGASNNQYGSSGVAPGAWPYLYRLGRGIGNALSFYDAARAVDRAVASGVDIINMSFGTLMPGGGNVPNPYGFYLSDALLRAEAAGVINIAAAGNDNRYQDSVRYPWFLYPVPASWSSVIAVGATDELDKKASYSNWGPMVQIFAPGVNLTASFTPGNASSCYTASQLFCASTNLTSNQRFDGTSAASPFVAGAVALMRDANFSLNRADVVKILQSTAFKSTGDPAVDSIGRINVYEAVKKAMTYVR